MSVFGIIRKGRQAAKEHNAQKAEKEKQESIKEPYKHVPTHAAVDALSGAPSTWREDDRPKIAEQNRRRSAMAASGMGRGMPISGMMTPVHVGMPRVNSSLSNVSYPSASATPVVQVPRTYSYAGTPQGWHNQGGEVVYSPMELPSQSSKGKEVERIAMVDSGRASRSSSKATSPIASSNDSNSSQDDLEIKPAASRNGKGTAAAVAVVLPPRRLVSDIDQPHRLHPSRRVSDPLIAATAAGSSLASRNPQYPAFSSSSSSSAQQRSGPPRSAPAGPIVSPGVPPVPSLPAMRNAAHSPIASSSSSTASTSAHSSSSVHMNNNNTTNTNTGATTPPTPKATVTLSPSAIASIPDFSPISQALSGPALAVGAAISTPTLVQTAVRRPAAAAAAAAGGKQPRFSELERIDSHSSIRRPQSIASNERSRSAVRVDTLPTEFDESSFGRYSEPMPLPPAMSAAPAKSNKLSKASATKQPKAASSKKRWSLFTSSKATAVAF